MEPLRAPLRRAPSRHGDGMGAAGWITAMALTLLLIVVAVRVGQRGWTLNVTQSSDTPEQTAEPTMVYECSDGHRSWRQSAPCPVSPQTESSPSHQYVPAAAAYDDEPARRQEVDQGNRAAEQRLMAEADARYQREVLAAKRNSVAIAEVQTANAVDGPCAALKSEKEQIQERMRRQGYSIREGEWLDARLRGIFDHQNILRCTMR